ncbi:sn-glycerol-3-phosphate ABC transporter ATP-binding protein UgpC [Marinovum sp. 2_MG-2023]|uniref:ABC transporter ATP-binding protein n=1 Tax=unclassified Marinovum TaxID=2647166 RepID=UPI0026E41960|nr:MULTISPECIES: sn-glycerol-3-phosphate ABC transporter ATP-binding protein UgpC [unclassified Marinovum]MDO6731213.1 sn-glycerol-3-phosphate ABC transporter ATP-binding protein UgpC [Marinovum sp. 2_MG-2023]MDO6780635.1 sn-glycerol-3-phosphate ABC transporter ATP-binding protein UgpC [Marinovum sp. 1_MG-2023]
MANVTIDNVIKRYGSVQVMHGVSVDIEDGEFVVLVGPSGCGKSTLLRMLAGLEEISDGTISIGDRVVNDVPPKERDIAMVFQSYALYPHKTVYDNIGFPLKMAKRPKAEIDEQVTKAAGILDLTKYLKRYPKELSGGQRQRVAMGRAIVRDPQVFLFDEPLSNLDAKLRVTMRIEIKELHQRLGTTIVYVTHDQIEAMTMADKIVVMRDGKVEQIGSPLDLYDNPNNTFVASFIGSPSMNFVHGKIATEAGQKIFLSDSGMKLPLPATEAQEGRAVTYGVRPEHIQIGDSGVPMEVVVVEPTGSETQIFAKSGKDVIDALVKERISARPQSTLGFVINPDDVHLFDRASEQRI